MLNRRTFIKDMMRAVIAGSLLAGSGYLLLRDNKDGQEFCGNDFLCKACKRKTSCSLPEAKQYREGENDQLNKQ